MNKLDKLEAVDSLDLLKVSSWVTAGAALVTVSDILAANDGAIAERIETWLYGERARLLDALVNSSRKLSALEYGAVMRVRDGDLYLTNRSGEGYSARLTRGLVLAADIVVIWRPSAEWQELIRRHNRKA